MTAETAEEEQNNVESLKQKGEEYFDAKLEAVNYEGHIRGDSPRDFCWDVPEGSSFYMHAKSLMADKPMGGYTNEGTDTVSAKAEFEKTLITKTETDIICGVFGYGEYGIGAVGKTIIDVGAGNSPFAVDMNKLWGELETKVIAVDPRYGGNEPNKVKAFAQDLTESGLIENSADEVVSHFGVTLVPPDELPTAIHEMLKVAKQNGKVKIFPCHVFEKIENFNDEKGNQRQKIGDLVLPLGVELTTRYAVDAFRLDIDKSSVNNSQLDVFMRSLADNTYKLQLWASKGLVEKRKNGYYVKDALQYLQRIKKVTVNENGELVPL